MTSYDVARATIGRSYPTDDANILVEPVAEEEQVPV
jgi:hypothetical protein